jgi:dipeptidyl-peptidase-4
MDTYPRQSARTRRYSLGLPTRFHVAEDGSRVVFLRSRAGDDPVAALWVLDVADGNERLVFDQAEAGGELTREERDRRERAGERLDGVTGFTADPNALLAAFVSGGRLMLADLVTGHVRTLEGAAPGAFDPRIDPTGRRVAYVAGGALRVFDVGTGRDRLLAEDADPDVSWGVAEFIAAEEMERSRGCWWAPDGDAIACARVDERPVHAWHIADPVDPAKPPRAVRYPQAGTANALVTLHVLSMDGERNDVQIDTEAFPYLVNVSWNEHGPLLAWVQARDQRSARVVGVDPMTGAVTVLRDDQDERWIHILQGVPAWLPGGRLLHTSDREDTRRLEIDGEPVTPEGLQVNAVLHAADDVWFLGTEDPTEVHVWRLETGTGGLDRITAEPGIHGAAAGGGVAVITSETVEAPAPVSTVISDGASAVTLGSFAEPPVLSARPTFFTTGARDLRCALLTPGGREPDDPLPVLLDPYGGPHFGRVVRAQRNHRESQWWADQGFAVLVADGRGTPNRGTAWERSIHMDVAGPVLQDQVDALHSAAEAFGFLDLSRVAMRGWSFGGYLTCLAVMRRPDVFHAGVAGAPSVDPALYDTHYTERYLGQPTEHPEVYEHNSVLHDAAKLERPLLLIHGMTDDNVYVAHTLSLSKALMEAGRSHSVLPLSGITHRPVDERLAENLLLLELGFLQDALGLRD